MDNFINKYKDIIVNRKGDKQDSNMTTINIINEIKPNIYYKITKNNLLRTKKNKSYIQKNYISKEKLKYCSLKNNWNYNIDIETTKSNILGNSSILLVNSELKIPKTNISNLYFYNAKLYKIGDIINFNTKSNLPVCYMDIGKYYIDEYIMKKAGGVYIEYHDRLHFHMPLNKNSQGYLILGKKKDDNILLSAFSIPYGYAIYTPGNVIHNDCFLIGKYMVIYSKTNNYSTALLQDKYNKPIKISIY